MQFDLITEGPESLLALAEVDYGSCATLGTGADHPVLGRVTAFLFSEFLPGFFERCLFPGQFSFEDLATSVIPAALCIGADPRKGRRGCG